MRMLAERLAPAKVETASDVGWSADALEAQAFAYLAVRSLRELPLTFPGTTGVTAPLTRRRARAAGVVPYPRTAARHGKRRGIDPARESRHRPKSML